MIRLDEFRLHPMAATTEDTSPPHTPRTNAEHLPSPLELSSKFPSHFCSTKLQAGSKLCFVGLSVAWEVSERWGWGGSGWGWVFQVELPLGVGKGHHPTSLCAWHELVLCAWCEHVTREAGMS